MIGAALILLALVAPTAAHAEMRLPAGFTAEVYVTGRGEAPDGRAAVGIPSTTSLAFDAAGALYATRTGRRYRGGEIEDLWPLLRFAPGVYTTAPFVHDHWEEVYLVSGDLIVGNDAQGKGGESFDAPTYACRPPGVHHGPFKSERGCLLYEIHYYDESKK